MLFRELADSLVGRFGVDELGLRSAHLRPGLADFCRSAAGLEPCHHGFLRGDFRLGGSILGLHAFPVQCGQQLALLDVVSLLDQQLVDMFAVVECEVGLADIDIAIQHQPGRVWLRLTVQIPPAAGAGREHQHQQNDQ